MSLLSLEKNRLAYLALLAAANALIGYSSLSAGSKVAVGLFGILLPLYVAFRTTTGRSVRRVPDAPLDLKFSPPFLLLAAGLALALFLRFYRLTDLFAWPTLDEGWNGLLALGLSKDWNWRFFYTFGEAPPLPVWCSALLFKAGASPAFALWFPSAVVSSLTVVAGFFAARRFFSPSFAWVCGGLLAFSHWPLYIGRIAHQGAWLPLWICLFFLAWGKFRDAGPHGSRWAAGAGAVLGLGSFTFTPWIPVAGTLLLWAVWMLPRIQRAPLRTHPKRPKRVPSSLKKVGGTRGKQYLPAFLVGFSVALVPFLLAVLREGYGHHIASLSPWGGWFKGLPLAAGLFKYFAVLLWGSFEKGPAYVPVWGGFLNPLLGAFFLLGILELVRRRSWSPARFLALAFLLFLLPGALSPNLEGFRIAQVLPLLLVVTALGIHPFLEAQGSRRRVLILAALLAVTAAFDFDQVSRPYRNPEAHPKDFGRPLRAMEKYEAYKFLTRSVRGLGAGNVYAHFGTDAFNDPTFSLMVAPFNAVDPLGPGASTFAALKPGWEAFLVDLDYRPFLERRFSGARWFPLPRTVPGAKDALLGILSRSEAGGWPEVHRILQKADRERFTQTHADFAPLLRSLLEAEPLAGKDPFLASLFWDKVGAYRYERLDYAGQLEAYQKATTEGYPAAHLYGQLGQLRLIGRDLKGAREAFQRAVQAPEDHTDAKAWLERLTPTEK